MDLYFIITNQMVEEFGLPETPEGLFGWTLSKNSIYADMTFSSLEEVNSWITININDGLKVNTDFAICKISPTDQEIILIMRDLLGIGNECNINITEITWI